MVSWSDQRYTRTAEELALYRVPEVQRVMSQRYRAVRYSRLSEEIVEQLERLILSKELRPGDPLPSERELALEFQVSRQALREAMRMLTQRGLVHVHPGRGSFVAQPSGDSLGHYLHSYLCLKPHLVKDFLEARQAIETETASLAAERATDEQLLALKTVLVDFEAHEAAQATWNEDDQARWIEADLNFHTELARAGGNEVLGLLVSSLRGALRESIRYFASHPAVVRQSFAVHRAVYEAVASRNSPAARQAMREHFRLTLDEVARGLPPAARPVPESSRSGAG